jgi:hypothetical protein
MTRKEIIITPERKKHIHTPKRPRKHKHDKVITKDRKIHKKKKRNKERWIAENIIQRRLDDKSERNIGSHQTMDENILKT